MSGIRDKRVLEITECLEGTGLFDDREMSLLKDYLSGAADRQALKELNVRDMSHVSQVCEQRVSRLLWDLEKKGKNELAGRIGDFLFAAGGISVKDFFRYMVLESSECRILEGEPVKRAALWAAEGVSLKGLVKTAEGEPENISKAMEDLKDMPEGEIRLLAAYFLMKYPSPFVSDGISREAGGRAGQEDAGRMERYEKLLISHISDLYGGSLLNSAAEEIREAVCQDRVDERILGLALHAHVNEHWLRVLGGAAFANYELSSRLKNVASICFAADTYKMLGIARNVDLRGNLEQQGGRFHELFGADSPELVRWAAENHETQILEGLFERSRQAYLAYMESAGYEYLDWGGPLYGAVLAFNEDKMDFGRYQMLSEIIKRKDPALYGERHEKALSRQRGKAEEEILRNLRYCSEGTQDAVRKYLDGNCGLEELRAALGQEQHRYSEWGGGPWKVLQGYQEEFGYDSFMGRCETALMISKGIDSYEYLSEGDKVSEEKVRALFRNVDGEGLSLLEQLNGYEAMVEKLEREIQITVYEPVLRDMEKGLEGYRSEAGKVFRDYLAQRREEMLAAIRQADVTGRRFGAELLGETPERNKEEILKLLQDPEMAVRDTVMELFYASSQFWEEEILSFLASRKADDRVIAALVLAKWNDGKYLPALKKALEKERSGKVMGLLEAAVQSCSPGETEERALSREELVAKLHKGNRKRSLAWAYKTSFSGVHRKDGKEADEQYLQAILLAYSAAGGANPEAVILAEELEEKELAVYVGEVFDKWMEGGAEARKSWVLYAAVIHGNPEITAGLQEQIGRWLQAGQNGMAVKAVRALTFSPEPDPLLFVDELSRKAKKEMVREAATKALEAAELRRGITIDELYERIIPDFGLDDNMRRVFDYGTRRFLAGVNTGLEIEISDEQGRKLKNLPAPGKRDEAAKAAAACGEFRQWRKQLNAVVSAQKKRLERAFLTGRKWNIREWVMLFVKNPVMRPFAMGLVWGLYEDGRLTGSFRRMEDGSFVTGKREKMLLPEGGGEEPAARSAGQIGLVHPIELSEDVLDAWRSQFKDYGIIPPVEQLYNPVNYKTEEEMGQECLERFNGSVVNDLVLGQTLASLGWRRGPMTDSGYVYSFFRKDSEIAMETALYFSGSFLGEEDDDVTVEEVQFFRLGQPAEGDDGGETQQSVCPLKDVPDRYFSEIVLHISRALASGSEGNENWEKNIEP